MGGSAGREEGEDIAHKVERNSSTGVRKEGALATQSLLSLVSRTGWIHGAGGEQQCTHRVFLRGFLGRVMENCQDFPFMSQGLGHIPAPQQRVEAGACFPLCRAALGHRGCGFTSSWALSHFHGSESHRVCAAEPGQGGTGALSLDPGPAEGAHPLGGAGVMPRALSATCPHTQPAGLLPWLSHSPAARRVD